MPNLTRITLRPLLESKVPLAMAWLNLGSLAIVEAAAASGADILALDLQHGLWDRAGLEQALTAAADVPVLVRVSDIGAVPISEALDAGAEGIIVPMVETADQAAAAIAFARYPPQGRRSGGGVRPLTANFADYVAASRTRTLVGIMIETEAGLKNLDAILAVPGIDLIFIGTGDLSVSTGHPSGSPALEAAFERIRLACATAGIASGLYTRTPQEARHRVAEGYQFVVISNDISIIFGGFKAATAAFSGTNA